MVGLFYTHLIASVFANLSPEIDMELFLELVVNDSSTGHIAYVDYRHQHYYLSIDDLQEMPILFDHWKIDDNERAVAIDTFEGVQVNYNQEFQRLEITVPPDWLPEQMIGSKKNEHFESEISPGFLVNYDIYATKPRDHNTHVNIWGEFRTFGQYGIFSHTGVYRSGLSVNQRNDKGYIRYDTYWQYSDEKKMTTTNVGDFITRPLSWSNAARLGGIQFSHNFNLRPDIITYPLPQFNGEVGLPSTVDLFINSEQYLQDRINAGPFVINNIPHISGASEAVIVATDALGRSVVTAIPFYVTSDLLRKGLFDYTVSVGAIRKQYGIKNFSYGKLAMDGSFRYGLTDDLTVDFHSELTSSIQVIGAGLTKKLGQLGVVTAASAVSQFKSKQGIQLFAGYEYIDRHFNFSAKYTRRNQAYRDISSIEYSHAHSSAFSKESIQLTFSAPLGRFGTISTGHFSRRDHANNKQSVINFGWNRSFGALGSVFVYANRSNHSNRWSTRNTYNNPYNEQYRRNKWTASVQWVIPLDSNIGNITTSADIISESEKSYMVNYDRGIPSDGGWGWDLNYNHYTQSDDFYNANLRWRNNHLKMQGGLYGSRESETYWGSATGSLIGMDGFVFTTNQVNDSFVVVSTDGIADVPIHYENALVGETNKKGYFLVPWVPSYYGAKYEIDPLNLPISLHAPEIEKRIMLKSGGGYLLKFPIHKVMAVTATLVDEDGKDLSMGSLIIINGQEEPAYVGLEGLTYFENLDTTNELTVESPEGTFCHALIKVDIDVSEEDEIPHIGTITCTKGK